MVCTPLTNDPQKSYVDSKQPDTNSVQCSWKIRSAQIWFYSLIFAACCVLTNFKELCYFCTNIHCHEPIMHGLLTLLILQLLLGLEVHDIGQESTYTCKLQELPTGTSQRPYSRYLRIFGQEEVQIPHITRSVTTRKT